MGVGSWESGAASQELEGLANFNLPKKLKFWGKVPKLGKLMRALILADVIEVALVPCSTRNYGRNYGWNRALEMPALREWFVLEIRTPEP